MWKLPITQPLYHPANLRLTYSFSSHRKIPPEVKFITVVGVLKSYHQVELDANSGLMTTFLTLFGLLKYNRLLFGVFLAGVHYRRR